MGRCDPESPNHASPGDGATGSQCCMEDVRFPAVLPITKDISLDQLSSLDKAVTKKENEIAQLMKLVHFK